MNEAEFMGQLITAISVLLGCIGAVYGIISHRQSKREAAIKENTQVMTTLSGNITVLTEQFGNFESHNHETHVNIYGCIDKHKDILNKHELRIHDLEKERES